MSIYNRKDRPEKEAIVNHQISVMKNHYQELRWSGDTHNPNRMGGNPVLFAGPEILRHIEDMHKLGIPYRSNIFIFEKDWNTYNQQRLDIKNSKYKNQTICIQQHYNEDLYEWIPERKQVVKIERLQRGDGPHKIVLVHAPIQNSLDNVFSLFSKGIGSGPTKKAHLLDLDFCGFLSSNIDTVRYCIKFAAKKFWLVITTCGRENKHDYNKCIQLIQQDLSTRQYTLVGGHPAFAREYRDTDRTLMRTIMMGLIKTNKKGSD